jgi:hypothetical protein
MIDVSDSRAICGDLRPGKRKSATTAFRASTQARG